MIFEVTLGIILLSNQSVHPFVRSSVLLFVRSTVRSSVPSFVRSLVCSFVRLFIRSFVRCVLGCLFFSPRYPFTLKGRTLYIRFVRLYLEFAQSVYGMWITQVVFVQCFSYPFKMVYLFYSCIFFGQRLHSVSDLSLIHISEPTRPY